LVFSLESIDNGKRFVRESVGGTSSSDAALGESPPDAMINEGYPYAAEKKTFAHDSHDAFGKKRTISRGVLVPLLADVFALYLKTRKLPLA